MSRMTAEERRAFLTSGTRTGHVGLVRGDGRPHVTPVWFVLDGDDVMFTTRAHSVKGQTLVDDDRVTVSVDHPHRPYAFVMIEGVVSVSREPEEIRRWKVAICDRYDKDVTPPVGSTTGPRDVLVRVAPVHVVAVTYD